MTRPLKEEQPKRADSEPAGEAFKIAPLAYVILTKGTKGIDEEILLLQRSNGAFSLPAGHVNENEELQDAAARELMEETGVSVKPEDMTFVHMGYYINQQRPAVAAFYKATVWEGEPRNMEPEEHLRVGWYPMNNLPANMATQVRLCLQDIEAGKLVTQYRE